MSDLQRRLEAMPEAPLAAVSQATARRARRESASQPGAASANVEALEARLAETVEARLEGTLERKLDDTRQMVREELHAFFTDLQRQLEPAMAQAAAVEAEDEKAEEEDGFAPRRRLSDVEEEAGAAYTEPAHGAGGA